MTEDKSTGAGVAMAFRLFNEIGIIAQLSGNAFEKAMPEGMTLPQFTVLNHLTRLGGNRTPLQIANAMQVTKGTMTNTLQHLERGGYISVKPDPDDGRSKRIDISEAGREIHRRSIGAMEPMLAQIAALLSIERVEAVLPLLAELRSWLDKARD
jgi:DNA-binding MarR family transcriptional regulator